MTIYDMLHRKEKNGQLVVMDAPVDKDTPNALWQAERMKKFAKHFAGYGGNAMLWPPLTMAQGRSANNADGFGKQFDLNFGQFVDSKGRPQPTRWGTAQQVLDANEEFHKYGLKALEDTVIHQMDGGIVYKHVGPTTGPFYFELGPDGKQDVTLFPKGPECFVPNVPVDAVFDSEGNASFGDMISYTHDIPSGYMKAFIIKSIKARRQRLALDGCRLDDTKGENLAVTVDILNAVGGWNFGECWSNAGEIEDWIKRSGGKNSLDFPTHWVLQNVCDNNASLRTLVNAGLAGIDPAHAVRFADSADTDRNDDKNIKFNKLWAYFYIATTPGLAWMVYSGDYEVYGLGPEIDKIVWVSSALCLGAIAWEYESDNFLVWSRNGDGGQYGKAPGALCGFSKQPVDWVHAWVHTPFPPNTRLHDYLGHCGDVWTNKDGWVYISAPPNVNGSAKNYFAYSICNKDGSPLSVNLADRIKPIPHNPHGSLTAFSDVFPKLADTSTALPHFNNETEAAEWYESTLKPNMQKMIVGKV